VPDTETSGLNGSTDADLVARAAAGDHEAFGVLVVRHQASVFRMARAVTHSREAAEDVLQQAFLAAWQALPRFRGEASLRTWLLTIARHAAVRRQVAVAREPIDDLAIRSEARATLSRALSALPAEDRTVLTLRELEGLSGEDTAALLGLSLPAMKSRLHRARLRLATEIRKEGFHAAGRA
jgi:RNA polymerase sigma-70 factor (ECF subfamily)